MTGLSRRKILASLPAAGLLGACASGQQGARTAASAPAELVARPAMNRVPAAGFAIFDGSRIIAQVVAGRSGGLSDAEIEAGLTRPDFSIDTPFRAASVSKVVVALTALSLHRAGQFDLDAPLPEVLPQASGLADDVTTRHLLAHISGLADPEQYWLAHPGDITPMMVEALRERTRPAGDYFQYCNFGYGIAATAMEAATGTRFDELAAREVLGPMQFDAGFNWSGVSPQKRRSGATLYLETATGWQIEVDGPDTLLATGPAILLETGAELFTYTPGQNGTLFSPQGGLRASLQDLARMIHTLGDKNELTRPVWTLNTDASNGLHDSGYYTAFGSGVQIHPASDSLWPGYTLFGHHGEAYGLYSGAWHAPDLGLSFAYAVTGTPDRPPVRSPQHAALNEWTAPLARAAYEAAGLA